MNYIEYGKENKRVIIFLHVGGLSWWNYRAVAEMLQYEYRVILPILDGHAASDRDFTTIEDNAAEVIEFIDEQFGGSVLLLGGLSLGGQILLEILSQRKDICQFALIESALVIPSKFMYSLIKPFFGSCYGLIGYKWFSKLQFQSLWIKTDLSTNCRAEKNCRRVIQWEKLLVRSYRGVILSATADGRKSQSGLEESIKNEDSIKNIYNIALM